MHDSTDVMGKLFIASPYVSMLIRIRIRLPILMTNQIRILP
jgi:hypothetical protein